MMKVILGVGIGLYFLIRLYLAAKNKLFKKIKISARTVIFSLIDLLIILVASFQFSSLEFGKVSLPYQEVIQLFGLSLFIIGVGLSSWARLILGRNWRPIFSEISQTQQLVIRGPYSKRRHPIYFGMILMGFGFEITLTNWLVLAIIPLVFLLYYQARLEEKYLQSRFPQYKEYKQKTRMFL